MKLDVKPFWKSKTIWVNFLFVLDIVLNWAAGHPDSLSRLGFSSEQSVALLAVINAILRFRTSTTINAETER